jgi:hypothetical protein
MPETLSSVIVRTFETVPVRRKAIQWTGDNLAQVQNFVGVDTDLKGRDHQMFVHPLPDWLVGFKDQVWEPNGDCGSDCNAALYVRCEDNWRPVNLCDWVVEYDHGHQVFSNAAFQRCFRNV